jgi:hypothetical protein
MTELEAVNKLLSVIGEAPIDKLADITDNEISDASLARKTLHEINRDVQSEGWLWNTEVDVPLSADKDGGYELPPNALRADFSPNRYPYSQYVMRGLRVYDRAARTYNIGANNDNAPVVVDHMVLELPWDELPHPAQDYITIRAGRIYSDRYINSNVIFQFSVQDEEYSRAQLMRAEEASLSSNLLWGNDRSMGQGISYIPAMGQRHRMN